MILSLKLCQKCIGNIDIDFYIFYFAAAFSAESITSLYTI